ncbi:MAG TPA: hypothetical protein VGQ11_02000 [Candidatus Acidoferrales bacterium]|nr:hypothetical protein [Candidatus Acidoferrales bacterium]
MTKQILRNLWVLIAILLLAGAASADTLELRSGSVLKGRYLGGTQNNIRFEVNGQVEYYPVTDILTLSFGSDSPAPSGRYSERRPAAPAPVAQSDRIIVPAGTLITVRMIDGVDSATNKPGDTFRASLETELSVDGALAVPRNSDVRGRLVEAKEAGKISGKSELRLELTDVMVNGVWVSISTGDYDVTGKSRGKDSATKIGGGAVVGAVVGAIAGGGKGAAIGSVVGAGAGTAIQIFTKGEQVKVPSETVLDFTLEKELVVNTSAARPRN